MAAPRLAMRAQFTNVLADWGVVSNITRFTASKNSAGKMSGTFVELASGGVDELIWIQPLSGTSDIDKAGLNAETTHLAYQAHTGRALIAKDRIIPTGAEFVYDVIKPQVFETHRRAEVKQVRRI